MNEHWALQQVKIKNSIPLEEAKQKYKDITKKKPKKVRETKNFHVFRHIPPTKFKSKSFRTKVVNDDIQLVFGELKEGHEHLSGSGLFDYFKKGVDYAKESVTSAVKSVTDITDFSKKAKDMLKRFGDYPVVGLTIVRHAIQSDPIFNAISFGQWKQLKKKYGYDNLFHMMLTVTLKTVDSNKKIKIEQIGVISINENTDVAPGDQTFEVPMKGKEGTFTLNQMLYDTKKRLGTFKFFEYSAFTESGCNCQGLVANLLRTEGLYGEEEHKFVYQDVSGIYKEIRGHVPVIADAVTKATGLLSKYFNVGGNKITLNDLSSDLFTKKGMKGGMIRNKSFKSTRELSAAEIQEQEIHDELKYLSIEKHGLKRNQLVKDVNADRQYTDLKNLIGDLREELREAKRDAKENPKNVTKSKIFRIKEQIPEIREFATEKYYEHADNYKKIASELSREKPGCFGFRTVPKTHREFHNDLHTNDRYRIEKNLSKGFEELEHSANYVNERCENLLENIEETKTPKEMSLPGQVGEGNVGRRIAHNAVNNARELVGLVRMLINGELDPEEEQEILIELEPEDMAVLDRELSNEELEQIHNMMPSAASAAGKPMKGSGLFDKIKQMFKDKKQDKADKLVRSVMGEIDENIEMFTKEAKHLEYLANRARTHEEYDKIERNLYQNNKFLRDSYEGVDLIREYQDRYNLGDEFRIFYESRIENLNMYNDFINRLEEYLHTRYRELTRQNDLRRREILRGPDAIPPPGSAPEEKEQKEPPPPYPAPIFDYRQRPVLPPPPHSEPPPPFSGEGNKSAGFIRAMMARESKNPKVHEKYQKEIEEKNKTREEPITKKELNRQKFQNYDREGFKMTEMSKTTHDVVSKKKAKTRRPDKKRFYDYVLRHAPQHQPQSTVNPNRNYRGTFDLSDDQLWSLYDAFLVEEKKPKKKQEEEINFEIFPEKEIKVVERRKPKVAEKAEKKEEKKPEKLNYYERRPLSLAEQAYNREKIERFAKDVKRERKGKKPK